MRMAELDTHQPQSIHLDKNLGYESRIRGGSAFSQLTETFKNRLHEDPAFTSVLQTFVEQTKIRFNDKRDPELLSEKLLGTWVGLAAEHTLLDAKTMPDEKDGARWIQLENQVDRVEDAILLAHRGEKNVTLDERVVKIIADPSGDMQKHVADSLEDIVQTISSTSSRVTRGVLPVVVAGTMLFKGCGEGGISPTITQETTRPIVTLPTQVTENPIVTEQPTIQPTPAGPEATTGTPSMYPTSLSVEDITNARPLLIDAPSSITDLVDVQAIISKHTEFAREKGLIFDHMEVKYVPSIQRWYIYPADTQGNIVGWLELKDDTSQTGWRFAEQPTWDSQFSPSNDEFRFGLPALHDSRNHFEIDVIGGSTILVEVTPEGNPQFWNSVTLKQTMEVKGREPQAPIVYAFGLKEGMTIADCNKLIMNKDGTIPDEYLKQERAWIAANKPPFLNMDKWAYAPGYDGVPGEFPVPMYRLLTFGPVSPESQLPEQSLVGCATLEDGTFVLSMVVRPQNMQDITNITPENIPIFHIALTQSGIDWVNTHRGLQRRVAGYRDTSLIPNISEMLSVLTNQEIFTRFTIFNIYTVAPLTNNGMDNLDPSLQVLKTIMGLNNDYVGTWTEQERIGSEGQGLLITDVMLFMSRNDNKVERGKQISTRLIPGLALSVEFGE